MATETLRDRIARWRVTDVLAKYPGLRLTNATDGGVQIAGVLTFLAQQPGTECLQDEYHIQLVVPRAFPNAIPLVRETGGRIPPGFHTLTDGSLCLGSPTRLRLHLVNDPTLLGFVERCIIPYLYGRTYFERNKTMPLGELDHGTPGIRQDLALLFGTTRTGRVEDFARLTALKKRHANKRPCPCGSGYRLGRCHHRHVNTLRRKLGRFWFRQIYNSLRPPQS
jgi:hypothetical protein